MKFWLHSWRLESLPPSGWRLKHIAGNLFSDRGVSVGDRIYIFTRSEREILLVCDEVVDEFVTEIQARRKLGYAVYPGHDHIMLASPTPVRFDRAIPTNTLKKLRFQSKSQRTLSEVKFASDGFPDRQTFRTLRNLTPGSAKELDQLP